jgi:hypothetical protein
VRIPARRSIATLVLLWSSFAAAQTPESPVSTHCDSIVAASRVDSIAAGLFISANRIDGGALSAAGSAAIASQIGSIFVPPRPFPLTVFSGTLRMHALRAISADTAAQLRAPTVTGIYRFTFAANGAIAQLATVRASLMPGFDSAAVVAIRGASNLPGGLAPVGGLDSSFVEVRLSSDSVAGALRLVSAYFPRMLLADAVPARANPAAQFPDAERRDSVTSGEAILRFVVDRFGKPVLVTAEVVRATSTVFLEAALAALPKQNFAPATIHGCPVAEVIDYPFTFVAPDSAGVRLRH